MLVKGTTDKENPVSYKLGEPIVFTLSASGVDVAMDLSGYVFAWKRTGAESQVQNASADVK